jgi:hypothetical protein
MPRTIVSREPDGAAGGRCGAANHRGGNAVHRGGAASRRSGGAGLRDLDDTGHERIRLDKDSSHRFFDQNTSTSCAMNARRLTSPAARLRVILSTTLMCCLFSAVF